jgi:predicted NUDIX family phosphoesterase
VEFVYAVKRRELFERRFPHGLEVLAEDEMSALVARIRARGFFVERRHAETDASLKQVIPYCVVVRGGEVFLTRRSAKGGDARLFGKRSIGVGGHINPVDGADVLGLGLAREVSEELDIEGAWDARAVGVLNDDSTDVGSVHVGLVHVVRVEGAVRVRETETLSGGFVAAEDLARLCRDERGTFETWSALLVDRLAEVLHT